jgi:hypothetical protein
VPLLLGALPQLNFVVPMTTILLAYALILALVAAVSYGVLLVVPNGSGDGVSARGPLMGQAIAA